MESNTKLNLFYAYVRSVNPKHLGCYSLSFVYLFVISIDNSACFTEYNDAFNIYNWKSDNLFNDLMICWIKHAHAAYSPSC